MNRVALVIIYNHQYNENIEILEQIYKDRFSNIYHLVPFYNDEKLNVIPVYENSYYFQGYVAQGFKSFFKKDYDHYFFVADDLLLNPLINETNYTKHLKLKQNTCFIPELVFLHERKDLWPRVGEAFHFNVDVRGVEVKNQLPDYSTALQLFKKFGLEIKPLSFKQIYNHKQSFAKGFVGKEMIFSLIRRIKNKFVEKKYDLPYPFIGGYSDCFVISSDTIKQFCHYCGVFATLKLHVEISLPTSLILSAQDIVTENDLILQGKALWTKRDYAILEKYQGNLNKLLDDFPLNYLYLHPIKLSKWEKNYEK